ncbi:hypothetical protein [Parvibaculum sp.]|uniref:hypothetical protein n=1 Tax=Parvibaculum sp. TaxID=2024848 RepID=UPI001DE0A46F|nr:hypothetical protein [Parvibaculum sp.]MBX3488905.1 hypothetical protein [Parvibaculum sp.]
MQSDLLAAAFAEAAEIAATGRHPETLPATLAGASVTQAALTLVQLAGKTVSHAREGDLKGCARAALRLAAAAATLALEARRRIPKEHAA